MANNCYSVLIAPDIEKIWDGKSFESVIPTNESEYKDFISEDDTSGMWGWRRNNWGCDGRIFCSETTEGIIQLLTAWNPPWYVISRLSKILGDVELKHSYQDQENYGSNAYSVVWKDGRMISAYVQTYDFDNDVYSEKKPIEITDKYNC